MRTNNFKKILASIIIGAVAIGSLGCTKDEKTINHNVVLDDNEESSTTEQDKNEVEEFSICTMDVNTDEKVIAKNIELNKSLSIEDKLVALSGYISKEIFSDLPLNLVEIKDIDGKKVAVFNFDEVGKNAQKETLFQDYEGKSWFQYFQGSAGGKVTEYTLLETLLQRDYQGEWIDGIEFKYKGGNMDFQHTPKLSEVVYR